MEVLLKTYIVTQCVNTAMGSIIPILVAHAGHLQVPALEV